MEPQLANLTGLVALDVLGLDGPSHGERPGTGCPEPGFWGMIASCSVFDIA